jgi:hypothetical protein
MEKLTSIPKTPMLKPPEDYNFLRQQGITYIQQLGSRLWTDYNIHDPGITTLELMCFAITDLAYRTGFDRKDIFAAFLDKSQLAGQAFFEAHDILTVNPLTIRDYRKLIIDQLGIQNAWLTPRVCHCGDTPPTGDGCGGDCNCETEIYADEKAGKLSYEKKTGANTQPNEKVSIKGLYDVLIAFESDPVYGDINDGRVHQTLYYDQQLRKDAVMELRLPDYNAIVKDWDRLQPFTDPLLTVALVLVTKVTGRDGLPVTAANIAKAVRQSILVDVDITLSGQPAISLKDAVLNIYIPASTAGTLLLSDVTDAIEDAPGIVTTYKKNIEKIHSLLGDVRNNLHAHRNLDETFCNIGLVPMEDVSVCMDIELQPDADIEKVEAALIVSIEQYLNPTIPVYSLPQLLDAKYPITDIFNGPQLQNGFMRNEDLDKAVLRGEVYASDMINSIMDIAGVISVNNFLMTSYDGKGEVIYHSRPWSLPITPGHQPRLYIQRSKFLFYKNGFPFLKANAEELNATLQSMRSSNEHLKTPGIKKELDLPVGEARNFMEYYPVQYSYPVTYGIGEDGLPDNVPDLRKAQARQLKAYLLFFEQMLVNYLAQLQHVGQLFLVDETQTKSYFTYRLTNADIADVDTLYNGLTPAKLQELKEPGQSGLVRRNQFMDHLMARFAENFTDYSLLMYDEIQAQKDTALTNLLMVKTDFLLNYPEASRNRARAIDYTIADPCGGGNRAGLQVRLTKMLNIKDEDDMMIIEHLLLRPRIPGQLLLPVCLSDGGCHTCYDNDPYSFRLTYVMPGWADQNLRIAYRRYAENTIRLETPGHLLPKICWAANEACSGNLLCDFTDLLWNAQAPLPERTEELDHAMCLQAAGIITAMNNAYREHLSNNEHNLPDQAAAEALYDEAAAPLAAAIPGIPAAAYPAIRTWIVNYWLANTDCFIYSRLKKAWCAWLAENAKLQPQDAYLENRLRTLLQQNNPNAAPAAICQCTAGIMEKYGHAIHQWVQANFAAGLLKADFDTMAAALVPGCAGLSGAGVNALFITFYDNDMIALLQTHARLIQLLYELKSIYPPATLHDCEDGNDKNPVRLGATALG